MNKVAVNLNENAYQVAIGNNILSDDTLFAGLQDYHLVLIADQNAYAQHGEDVLNTISKIKQKEVAKLIIDAGESSKSWDKAIEICEFLAKENLPRNGMVVVLGGGVVSDLAGFVSSIWLRGIKYMTIPTTVLAQVDASVGGKTGINITSGKNLIGSFHQPSSVIIDINTLKTLPQREYFAGFAEIVKHGILDQGVKDYLVDHLDKFTKFPCQDNAELIELITKNIAYKAKIVAMDEKEAGTRMYLNLGHTFAHALEKILNYSDILHGEAVAIGLIAATKLASKLNLCAKELQFTTEKTLQALHLPIRFPQINTDELINAMLIDKKNLDSEIRFVLPNAIGKISIKSDVPKETIKSVVEELKE